MAAALQPRVHLAGIAAMHRCQRTPKSVLIRRHQDQVDVIRHQHPGPDRDVGGPAGGSQKVAVERVIRITEEGLRAPVSPLGHVMRQTGDDETSKARHAAW